MDEQDPVVPGEIVDNCRIERRLGAGAFGAVYLAQHLGLDQPRALKFLLDPTGDLRARFLNEARHTAKLAHANIVIVHNVGEHRGRPFINMEYLSGVSMRALIERGPLDLPDAVRLIDQVLAALGTAHAKGLVHRDVKPDNTMILEDGVVKVVDFGLSLNIVGAAAGARLTMNANAPMGTPLYMAPEQWESSTVGPAADVWSVGVMLYELCLGRVPFNGNSFVELMKHIIASQHVPLARVRPDVPQPVSAVIDRMLAKSADQRPADARRAREELAEVSRKLEPRTRRHAEPKLPDFAGTALPETLVQRPNEADDCVRYARQGDGGTMVAIPETRVVLGSDSGDFDERPAHEVWLSSFLLDESPVTRQQFATFLMMWGSDRDDAGQLLVEPQIASLDRMGPLWEPIGDGDAPITGVTWYGAMTYARWAGVTLPTEAQLEHAMGLCATSAAPASSRLRYLVGTVRHWCIDSYDEHAYAARSRKDPANLDHDAFRVVRGLSRTMSPRTWTRTRRDFAAPHDVAADLGFRCAFGREPSARPGSVLPERGN